MERNCSDHIFVSVLWSTVSWPEMPLAGLRVSSGHSNRPPGPMGTAPDDVSHNRQFVKPARRTRGVVLSRQIRGAMESCFQQRHERSHSNRYVRCRCDEAAFNAGTCRFEVSFEQRGPKSRSCTSTGARRATHHVVSKRIHEASVWQIYASHFKRFQ